MKFKIKYILAIMGIVFITYFIFHEMNYKQRIYWLDSVEKRIGNRYVIGYNWKNLKICDNYIKYWCLEWNIISYKILWNDIYIYYNPYLWYYWTEGFLKWDKVYKVFGPYDTFIIDKIENIPKLFRIDTSLNWWREFYQKEDIDKLNKIDKEIFNDLIKNN